RGRHSGKGCGFDSGRRGYCSPAGAACREDGCTVAELHINAESAMTNFLELVFVLGSLLAFLVVARSIFGWVARAEGYSLTFETTVNDNPAVGVRFGLFLMASAIPFVGLLEPSGAGLKQDFNAVAFYGLTSVVLLIVAREVNDKLILYKFSNDAEVIGKKNT